MAGIRFSLNNRVLSTLIMTGMLFMFAAGIINTLYYFFLAQNLHADPAFYGLLVSAPGVGGMVGAVLASKYVHRIGEVRTLWLSSLLWGGVVIALALQSYLLPATLLAFLIGVLNSGIGVVVAPLLLHATPRQMVGRAFATLSPCVALASIISTLAAGFLSSTLLRDIHGSFVGITINATSLLFIGAGLLTSLSGVFALINLRGVRLARAEKSDLERGEKVEPREKV